MSYLEFWRSKRILVTGHTGFKGSWLTLWLLSLGAEVWGYSLELDSGRSLFKDLSLVQNSHHSGWGVFHSRFGDLRDLTSLRQVVVESQPDFVFHLAAQPLVRRSYRDPLFTWSTNVLGSLNLLESLKDLYQLCCVVMVTTDKVYVNQEWDFGYREVDRLGGHDPYSASKAAAEIAIASWRSSFCGPDTHQTPYLRIATARAGNVIGGGDWAVDRIVPDAMRALSVNETISVRQPNATRPWQHVLEPLGGYLLLAEELFNDSRFATAYNFGPTIDSNRSVQELVETTLQFWPGSWSHLSDQITYHEAGRLNLQIDKAYNQLGWKPIWPFITTVDRTVSWYRSVYDGASSFDCCMNDISAYVNHSL